jgi:predicted DNA-binding transcriptional regulator AlpA
MASTVQIDRHRTDRGSSRAAVSSPLLTAEDVAAITGLSVETLAQWRSQRKGIPFLKLSRNVVRYQQGDLDAWLAERIVRVEVNPTVGRER